MTVCDAHEGLTTKLTTTCTNVSNVEARLLKIIITIVTLSAIVLGASFTLIMNNINNISKKLDVGISEITSDVQEIRLSQTALISDVSNFIKYAPPAHSHTKEGVVVRPYIP